MSILYIIDLIQVPVDPLPEDRARRTIERIDLLNKVREEIIQNEKLDERLRLSLPSLDMPEWWIPGKHDKDLLFGAVRYFFSNSNPIWNVNYTF